MLLIVVIWINHNVAKPLHFLDGQAKTIREGGQIQDVSEKLGKKFSAILKTLSILSNNSRNAIEFIKQIEEGNLEAKLMVDGDADAKGTDHLGQSLESLRQKLKDIAADEKERNWATGGLARFVEILRSSDEDLETLSDKILSNLVNYLKANQGQLYILNDENPDALTLELTAFYAFDRKKYFEKSIAPGQGLVGQTYLEKGTIMLTEVPDDYVKVTSGLGEANPKCILLVPLKLNDSVYGILELASFDLFKDYEVEFIERIGESIASTIANAKTNQKTKLLLQELQEQQEEMRAQEEEMRQNMEELQATQEEMARKEKEIGRLLEKSHNNEQELQKRLDEIQIVQDQLELENAMFTGLMDILPDRITIKDKSGMYLRVNKTKGESLKNIGIESVTGKSDRDIFGEEHYQKALETEKQVMAAGTILTDKDEKLVMDDGSSQWFTVMRAPFRNNKQDIMGTIIISRNITNEVASREELKEKIEEIEKMKKQQK